MNESLLQLIRSEIAACKSMLLGCCRLIVERNDSLRGPNEIVGVSEEFNLADSDSAEEIIDTAFKDFALYLFASDGVISQMEANYFNEIFNENCSTGELKSVIINRDIYTHEFESRVPPTLRMAAYADAYLFLQSDIEAMECRRLIEAYLSLGDMLIECDEDADSSEQANLGIYIAMLVREKVKLFEEYGY